ncbi:hypothetical protein BROC_02139 [Candidatus Brocadiaceae bacterium]|nr:hypothetical protein BROC_02139 [Candidatus Brocadiaceae bacterium]
MQAVWFRVVLLVAMALPMLVLYATSTLGHYLSADLQFEHHLIGFLITSSFGVAAVLSLWAGNIVDYLGSRQSLRLLFATIVVAFIVVITTPNFYGLVGAAAICGIAQALANPVTNLLIAQQVPPAQKAGVVGLKQSGVQLSALFAGLVLTKVAADYGWRVAFGSIIPIALLFLLAVPSVTPKQHQAVNKSFALPTINPLVARLMSVQFCVGLSLSAFVTYLPTFAALQGMPKTLAGSLIAVFGVMGILSRIILTPLGAKLRDESWLLLTLVIIAALSVVITIQATPEYYLPLWVGAIGVGLTAVGTNAIAMSMLIRDPKDFGHVPTASGLVSVAFFGGFAIGPALYAALSYYSGSLALSWNTVIGIFLLSGVMAVLLAVARHKAPTESTEVLALQAEMAELKQRITVLEHNYAQVLTQLAESSPTPTAQVIPLLPAKKNKTRTKRR